MFGMIRFLLREYKKYRRITKAQKRMNEIWSEVKSGTKNKELIAEWARLQFVMKDPYGDQQSCLDKLNKERLDKWKQEKESQKKK